MYGQIRGYEWVEGDALSRGRLGSAIRDHAAVKILVQDL